MYTLATVYFDHLQWHGNLEFNPFDALLAKITNIQQFVDG